MLASERRSAISTSQLGLYSDPVDRHTRSRYNSITKKFVIGIMVVVAVVLIGIFWYDFTSAMSMNNKINQETKHIYILQNALKKPSNFTKKFVTVTSQPQVNNSEAIYIQDRIDNESYENSFPREEKDDSKIANAEYRSQNLNNFKLRKRVLKSIENDEAAAEGKQLFDNHAVVYRVRQRYKYPDSNEEDESLEESRPAPFHWELKTPQPTPFKRPRYPQLSQYRYPHASRNIQDIIKYLTNNAEIPNRGIKFTGVYVNPKKYDSVSEIGEMMSNSDRSEEDENPSYSALYNEDPFYQYKPKHLADVNLLATSNVRFSPTGVYKYNPYQDAYGRPINYNKQPTSLESQYENPPSYSNNYAKKRKPQPFSVMLDIYPITDIMEQNKKNSRPKQVPSEDYDTRRPIQFSRGPKFYLPPPQPMTATSNQALSDEEERQQMIFHLNLYPRRKNKLSRHDILQKSLSMEPEERQQFVDKVWTPLETIARHLAVERLKSDDSDKNSDSSANRYEETALDTKEEKREQHEIDNSSASNTGPEETITVPPNHKTSMEEDYASTEKYEYEAQKIVGTTTENGSKDSNIAVDSEATTITASTESSKDIDTIEGFKRFSESSLKTR